MIKVLHCYKTYYPETFGGIEQVIYQLCEGGVRRGIESTVFALSNGKSKEVEKLDNHQVYRVRKNIELASTPMSFSAIEKFKNISKNFDIIHYHFPYPFMDLMHFAASIKKPTVVTYHSDIVKQKLLSKIYSPLMHRFLDGADAIVASSPNYFNTSNVLKKHKDKVSVIPFGLDVSFYEGENTHAINKWLSLFEDGFFLFVGAFRYYKGLHILIDAAKESEYPILIVGAGPIERELKKQAEATNVKNVHFLGALNDEDKKALLSLCIAIVFPSHLRSEAFGISLLEGAIYGKPLISSEIGTGTTFININMETGLVVSPGNSYSLRKAMDCLWYDRGLASRLGEGARLRFNKLFTADKMVDSYSSLYKSLI